MKDKIFEAIFPLRFKKWRIKGTTFCAWRDPFSITLQLNSDQPYSTLITGFFSPSKTFLALSFSGSSKSDFL